MTKYIWAYVFLASFVSFFCLFLGLRLSYGYDFSIMTTSLFLPLVIKESVFLFLFFLAPVFVILSFVSVPWDRKMLKYDFLFIVLFFVWFFSCLAFDKATEEDGFLEWATFWCSLVAAVIFFCKGLKSHKSWFVAAFLWALFAMEEISWGQRLLGFDGPEILTRYNYQSEINLHNFLNPFIDLLYPVFFVIVWVLMIGLPTVLKKEGVRSHFLKETGFVLSSISSSGLWGLPLFLFYITLSMLLMASAGTGFLTGLGLILMGDGYIAMSSYFTIIGKEYVEGVWGLFGFMIAILPAKKPDLSPEVCGSLP